MDQRDDPAERAPWTTPVLHTTAADATAGIGGLASDFSVNSQTFSID